MTDDRRPATDPGPNGLTGVADSGLTRRRSLQALAAASAGGAVGFTGCGPSEHELKVQSRVRLAEDILSAYEDWYATACKGCSAGCGLIVRVVEGRSKKAEGNPDHPVNRGRLCARGQAVVQEEFHPDRIAGPLVRDRRTGRFTSSTWDASLDDVAARLRLLVQQGRGDRIALLTPPLRGHQALVVERFARGLGARWLTFDPLPELPLRAAVRLVFGQELLPKFDIQNAHFLLSFGADFLTTWLSPVHYGVEYGIFRQGVYRTGEFQPRGERPRGYMVHVEPQFSTTAANADEWVYIRPGREGLLALGMAQVIVTEGLGDAAAGRAIGGPAALEAYRPERIAAETGVPAERIRSLARAFAAQRPSLAIGGGQAGAHTNGTASVAAVLLLNVLTGNVGIPGGVLFNEATPIAGLPDPASASGLPEWQRLVTSIRSGEIDAAFVYDANPVYGLPPALQFPAALRNVPYVVSFSSFMDETTAFADRVLPSHLPLEQWGDDVPDPAPDRQVWTVQQPVVRPLHDTRSFYDVLLALAEEVGGPLAQALPWPAFRDALRSSAQRLAQDLAGAEVAGAAFEQFWVQLLQRGGWWTVEPEALPLGQVTVPTPATPAPALPAADALNEIAGAWAPPRFAGSDVEYPYHLVVSAHHTLDAGRGAHLPWLQGTPHPTTTVVWQTWVEVNPGVARRLGLREGEVVRLESPAGQAEVPVYINPASSPDVVAVPLGQGHLDYGRWASARGMSPIALLAPLVDEATGALAYGATRVRLTKTGRRIALPKFEGTVPARQIPEQRVVKVTNVA
jgi:menaquinone reductase, molybdopterin-binding-like subunit